MSATSFTPEYIDRLRADRAVLIDALRALERAASALHAHDLRTPSCRDLRDQILEARAALIQVGAKT